MRDFADGWQSAADMRAADMGAADMGAADMGAADIVAADIVAAARFGGGWPPVERAAGPAAAIAAACARAAAAAPAPAVDPFAARSAALNRLRATRVAARRARAAADGGGAAAAVPAAPAAGGRYRAALAARRADPEAPHTATASRRRATLSRAQAAALAEIAAHGGEVLAQSAGARAGWVLRDGAGRAGGRVNRRTAEALRRAGLLRPARFDAGGVVYRTA